MKAAIRTVLAALLFCFSAVHAQDVDEQLKQLQEYLTNRPAQPQQQPASATPRLEKLGSLLGGTSQREEVAIGRQIAGNLLGAAPLVKDKPLQLYVNDVGRWIASQSERADLQWHFGVIASDDINAFAIPGGYVYVTRGLYRLLRNEAGLAGVLAHEIAHVVRKHHLTLLQQSRLVEFGGKLLSKQAGENEQIRSLIGSGAEVVARSLDKSAEFEADRIGVVLAARAGYDPFGLPEVLQDLSHYSRDDGAVALLFKTHPLPEARLMQLSRVMGNRFDRVNGQVLAGRLYALRQ